MIIIILNLTVCQGLSHKERQICDKNSVCSNVTNSRSAYSLSSYLSRLGCSRDKLLQLGLTNFVRLTPGRQKLYNQLQAGYGIMHDSYITYICYIIKQASHKVEGAGFDIARLTIKTCLPSFGICQQIQLWKLKTQGEMWVFRLLLRVCKQD